MLHENRNLNGDYIKQHAFWEGRVSPSPHLDAGGTGVPSIRFCFGEWKGMRRPNRIARDKGDLPHPNCSGLCSGKITKSS